MSRPHSRSVAATGRREVRSGTDAPRPGNRRTVRSRPKRLSTASFTRPARGGSCTPCQTGVRLHLDVARRIRAVDEAACVADHREQRLPLVDVPDHARRRLALGPVAKRRRPSCSSICSAVTPICARKAGLTRSFSVGSMPEMMMLPRFMFVKVSVSKSTRFWYWVRKMLTSSDDAWSSNAWTSDFVVRALLGLEVRIAADRKAEREEAGGLEALAVVGLQRVVRWATSTPHPGAAWSGPRSPARRRGARRSAATAAGTTLPAGLGEDRVGAALQAVLQLVGVAVEVEVADARHAAALGLPLHTDDEAVEVAPVARAGDCPGRVTVVRVAEEGRHRKAHAGIDEGVVRALGAGVDGPTAARARCSVATGNAGAVHGVDRVAQRQLAVDGQARATAVVRKRRARAPGSGIRTRRPRSSHRGCTAPSPSRCSGAGGRRRRCCPRSCSPRSWPCTMSLPADTVPPTFWYSYWPIEA